jgi:YVTN family beta-propeller protein
MSLRKLFLLSMVAALCLGRPAFSQLNGIEVAGGAIAQVIGGKSPAVKVTNAEGKEVASIPIEKDPGSSIYSKSANTLYVLHSEKKDEHFISAVNLTTNRIDKQIDVGNDWKEGIGLTVELFMSSDGHRLFCYTNGKHSEPAIKVIDTSSNEIIATYVGFDTIDQAIKNKHQSYFFCKFLAADGDDLIVETGVQRYLDNQSEKYADHIVGFSGLSPKQKFIIDTGGSLDAIMFSKDKKYLFGTIVGNKKTGGSLVIFDLEKGTSVTHALTDHPLKLLRLGPNGEPWVLSNQEMRAFSETGEPGDRRIPLNKPAKSDASGETGAFLFRGCGCSPGETISLGNDYAAIQINTIFGGSQHKVALIDLKKLQLYAIIPTISAAEITRIRTSRYLSAVVASMAARGTIMFYPNLVMSNELLAARPDGRFLFVLDLDADKVTVIDVQTATVVRRIPVNGTVTKLQLSADGKHLICAGKKPQQINLETNELEN